MLTTVTTAQGFQPTTGSTRFVRFQASQHDFQVSYVSVQTANSTVISAGKSVSSNCGVCYGPAQPNVIVNGIAEARCHCCNPSCQGSMVWHASNNSTNDWIEIDLGQEFPVARVVYYNRADCCQSRANGAILTLLDTNRNQIGSAALNGDLVQTRCSPGFAGATCGVCAAGYIT